MSYADRGFQYQIAVRPETGGIRVSVLLDNPIPSALSGKAGFNLEFLPPAFFGKSYIVDDSPGMFPRHPGGPMTKAGGGITFTVHTAPLNYDAASALAAASRVLRGSDAKMADECLRTAEKVWDEEHKHEPVMFRSFNTAGGDLATEETKAAIELVIATRGGDVYQKRLMELLPTIQGRFMFLGGPAIRAIPYMNSEFKAALRSIVVSYKKSLDENLAKNPYGVPIAMGTWGGAGPAAGFASQMYFLHRAFPDIEGAEYALRGLDYVLGVHPVSDISHVSGIGGQSKLIYYDNNRADYTFIPGGMIPGVTVVQPDFPELMSDWPFLWYENEYVVDAATVSFWPRIAPMS